MGAASPWRLRSCSHCDADHALQRLLPAAVRAGGAAHQGRSRLCMPPDRRGDQGLQVCEQGFDGFQRNCVCGPEQCVGPAVSLCLPVLLPHTRHDWMRIEMHAFCRHAGKSGSPAPGGTGRSRSRWRCSRTCGGACSTRAPPRCGRQPGSIKLNNSLVTCEKNHCLKTIHSKYQHRKRLLHMQHLRRLHDTFLAEGIAGGIMKTWPHIGAGAHQQMLEHLDTGISRGTCRMKKHLRNELQHVETQ